MAQGGFQLKQVTLSCSICLGLLNEPVTIPCGHNYCKSCIENCWDDGEMYKCPQCRHLLVLRPILRKNTMLADMVEELTKKEKTGLQAAPEDVVSDSATFEKHQLEKVTCTRHNEAMKIFCRTDQQCICYLCCIDKHKDHNTVSAETERAERQKDLEPKRQEIQQRIQNKEKDMTVLQQELENINCSADEAVEVSENILKMLYCLIEKRSSDLKQQIRSQQATEAGRVKELQDKVEEEISELRRKDHELEQLSQSKDHTQFLLEYPLLLLLDESTEQPSPGVFPLRYFGDVSVAVLEVRDNVQDLLYEEWIKISHTLSNVAMAVQPETRDDFFKCSERITLDPNTAHARLFLSEGNRKATNMIKRQSCLSHPDRFINRSQALSQESLTGRHYWEVEWNGCGVYVAVAYKDISRRGVESEFGNNNKSWALACSEDGYEFIHNKISVHIPEPPESSRVGVYLDHSTGVLCFYNISAENMTLLHRVQTTFTQPLYAGLRAFRSFVTGSSAEFCEPKQNNRNIL